MRILCIFAIPRTGSNRLCNMLMRTHFNNKFELFHRQWSPKLSDAERAALDSLSGGATRDPAAFNAWKCEHVTETLDTLLAHSDNPLVFKVFPGHLSKETIRETILSRPDTAFLVLRRRPIECFISSVKARKVETYVGADTTDLKPAINAGQFLRWCERNKGWQDWASAELAELKRPFAELTYEHAIAVPDQVAATEALYGTLRELGIRFARIPTRVAKIARQDREDDYRNRVRNWPVFERRVRESSGGGDLLGWAVAPPR